MFLLSSNLCAQYQVFQRNNKLLCPRQSGSVDRAKKSEPGKKNSIGLWMSLHFASLLAFFEHLRNSLLEKLVLSMFLLNLG